MSHNLWGVVDMGSNGIRFSITDLTPLTARILPVLYQDRSGISLYNAQWNGNEKVPIPDDVIHAVLQALKRFQRTCRDFKVPENQVRVIATEATRVAINSAEYRAKIKEVVGWDVEMLPKEEEGATGALGVASSFANVKGIMMDLGGGSTQITWIDSAGGTLTMSPAGSVSLPYGAAALTRRLDEANEKGKPAVDELRDEITHNLREAVKTIDIPQDILESPHGSDLYLSGGGFRGWGFVLMSQHPISPYPIPIINGFTTSIKEFHNTELVTTTAQDDDDIFRVSDRRASQIPAVALLVSCLETALPTGVHTVHFAQGGVREGVLYPLLSTAQCATFPLEAATRRFVTSSSLILTRLLQSFILADVIPHTLHSIASPLAQSMYIHTRYARDIQAASALRATTTGSLAAVHGTSHFDRAVLALALCERWGGRGALAPMDGAFYDRLIRLVDDGSVTLWCIVYLGRVARVIGEIFPAGVIGDDEMGLAIEAEAKPVKEKEKENGKKGDHHDHHPEAKWEVVLNLKVASEVLESEAFQKAVKGLEKLGKKKNWPTESGGCKVDITVKPA